MSEQDQEFDSSKKPHLGPYDQIRHVELQVDYNTERIQQLTKEVNDLTDELKIIKKDAVSKDRKIFFLYMIASALALLILLGYSFLRF